MKYISLDPKHETVVKSLMDFNERKIGKLQKTIDDNHKDLSKRLNQQNETMKLESDYLRNKIEDTITSHSQILNELRYISQEMKQLKMHREDEPFPEDHTGKYCFRNLEKTRS